MEKQSVGKRKRFLTQQSFEQLLVCFDADRERAGEQYEVARRKLIKFFECHSLENPEDNADETLDRVACRIAEGEIIHSITGYLLGTARLILMESIRKRQRERTAFKTSQEFQTSETLEETETSNLKSNCFDRCLHGLSEETRRLILEYYQEDKHAKIEGRKTLADQLGLPLNALRIRAHRIRAKLEVCMSECLRSQTAG